MSEKCVFIEKKLREKPWHAKACQKFSVEVEKDHKYLRAKFGYLTFAILLECFCVFNRFAVQHCRCVLEALQILFVLVVDFKVKKKPINEIQLRLEFLANTLSRTDLFMVCFDGQSWFGYNQISSSLIYNIIISNSLALKRFWNCFETSGIHLLCKQPNVWDNYAPEQYLCFLCDMQYGKAENFYRFN